MEIKMPKGDIRPVAFTVYDPSSTVSDVDFDEIYFTVKRDYSEKNYVFQKRLTNGTIEKTGNGEYKFIIEANDTDNLRVGKYVFDIELIYGNEIKQTSIGVLELTNEVTLAVNEV